MIVIKKFVVDTESVDEAHELTKPSNDKVETLEVGSIKPFVEPQSPAPTAAGATARVQKTVGQPGLS
jgi:hypothetical protein